MCMWETNTKQIVAMLLWTCPVYTDYQMDWILKENSKHIMNSLTFASGLEKQIERYEKIPIKMIFQNKDNQNYQLSCEYETGAWSTEEPIIVTISLDKLEGFEHQLESESDNVEQIQLEEYKDPDSNLRNSTFRRGCLRKDVILKTIARSLKRFYHKEMKQFLKSHKSHKSRPLSFKSMLDWAKEFYLLISINLYFKFNLIWIILKPERVFKRKYKS